MLTGARTGTWARGGVPLPYDAEVEYLQSAGAQYIKSGASSVGSEPLSFRAKVTLQKDVSIATIFGAERAVGSNFMMEWLRANTNGGIYYVIVDRNGFRFTTSGSTFEISAEYDGANLQLTVDGTSRTATSSGLALNNIEWYLFCRNNDGVADCFANNSRIYYLQFSDRNRGMIRDFIPVRVGSGANAVGYLFDRVSGQLFGNEGTGKFIIGPDKA